MPMFAHACRLAAVLTVFVCSPAFCKGGYAGTLPEDWDNSDIREVAESVIYMTDSASRVQAGMEIFRSGVRNADLLRLMYGSSLVGADWLMVRDNADSSLFYLNMCLSYASRIDSSMMAGHSWIVANAYNALGLFYINKSVDYPKAAGYFFRALEVTDDRDCPELYPVVLSNLVMVHYLIGDPAGMEYAQLCREYMLRHRTPLSEFLSSYSMALMLYLNGRYVEAEAYVKEAVRLMSLPEVRCTKFEIVTCTIYARILFAMGRDAEAVRLLDRVLSFGSPADGPEYVEAVMAYGDYFMERGDHERASALYARLLGQSSGCPPLAFMDKIYLKASQAAEMGGDCRTALDYYKKFYAVSDSTMNVSKEHSLAELKVKYRIEQYENQIRERRLQVLAADKRRQTWFFLFLVSSVFSAGLWIYLRSKNRYYERLVVQYKEKISLGRYMGSALSESRSLELFNGVNDLMRNGRIYRDSDLNVDKLASMLQTNRSYLSRVINEHSGMNYSRFVTRFRMEEAVEKLSDPAAQVLMKSLALEVGFKSATAFSKAFAEETGMSPSVFRRKVLEMQRREKA